MKDSDEAEEMLIAGAMKGLAEELSQRTILRPRYLPWSLKPHRSQRRQTRGASFGRDDGARQ